MTGRLRSTPHHQGGLTLVELLVAMVLTGILFSVVGNVLVMASRVGTKTQAGMESSTSAFRSSSRFADDVTAAGPIGDGTAVIGRGQTGCGGTTSVVRFIGPGAGSAVTVRSYTRVSAGGATTLVRRKCSGSTLSAALSATPATETVVPDLAPATTSTVVTCDGDGPTPPYDDQRCAVVSLSVTTTTGYRFTLSGALRSTLSPTATTAVTPVRAPVTGTCTLEAAATAWGATGGYAGGSGGHNGDATLYTYNDTNQRTSFIRFDLTAPCTGAGDSWPKLPGGRTLTSVKLYLAYLGKTSDSCGIFPGISYDGQVLETLNDASGWTEASLTGANMPSGTRNSYSFNVASSGSATMHVNAAITDAVRQWYTVGGWKNNGFRLRRNSVGDTCGKSNKFGSRFQANASLRPKLVITWG